jgi:hypothetical protein
MQAARPPRRVLEPVLFVLAGAAFMTHWLVAEPAYGVSTGQSEWRSVLGFSTALLCLAAALTVFARLLASAWNGRLSVLAGVGAAAAGVTNVLEDGLQLEWAFWGFVGSVAVIEVALLTLAGGLVLSARSVDRLLAIVPAGTLAAIALYVAAGGLVMLATWLAAAGMSLSRPRR